MIDEHDVREMLLRRANTVPTSVVDAPKASRRARRRLLANGAVAVLATAAIAVATFIGVDAVRTAPIPADDRPEELGIFAPVAGLIVYENDGVDRGYDPGLWAVDPSGASDTAEGPSVAEDVASTLVGLDLEDATPLDWSNDGTKLLLKRTSEDLDVFGFPQEYLYVLHADGSETQLNDARDPMNGGPLPKATISPDGTRVVFAGDEGLYVVDAEGGRPVRLPSPSAGYAPTFSPDGTQIAYLVSGDHEEHVWVMDADGSDAHEILADEATLFAGVSGLEWSPAGDRLAIGVGDHDGGGRPAIYTFAPDGSDFTQVINGGISPYWSPDGTRIAYTIPCDEHPDSGSCPEGSIRRSEFDPQPGDSPAGLAIADADGSNLRAFGFAASGPWHPAASTESIETTPLPSDSFARVDGEILSFTSGTLQARGDLVAVNPATGEERILVEDLDTVYSARWSGDGRWVAYETSADGDVGLWVVGASREPRLVATGGSPDMLAGLGLSWFWSPDGANLATIDDSTLRTIDLTTGETTDLGGIVADLLGDSLNNTTWASSPDGARIVFSAAGGALHVVDVRSGERSPLVRLPVGDGEWIDRILWSPDGAHIAVRTESESGAGSLYVMDADGSNGRVLADDSDPLVVDWSADGTRLALAGRSQPDAEIRIRVAPMDGAAQAEIGSVSFAGCLYNYRCDLTWSPDGTQIGFLKIGGGEVTAFDADGAGETGPIDELTYAVWDGGSYDLGGP